MELIRGLHNLAARHRGCVASIGNFDGVHRGHQAVIARLRQQGREHGLPTVAIVFEPQPQEYFQGAQAPARLTRLREKFAALAHYGLDRLLCVRFDARLAALSAEQFIDHVLVQGLQVRHLVVGDDFRFGRGRSGDYALLERAGPRAGFSVEALPKIDTDGERVSSTRVRQVLATGDVAAAARLLNRPFRISGRVARGDRRGRTIGVPTANVLLHRAVLPLRGVYIVEVAGLAPRALRGVANIGTRPTVDGTRALLEVHLFDFAQDIYFRHIDVDFLHKLRDEQRFASFDELKQRIARDIAEARSWLRQAG